jgi:abhydrolase domain-containing protein 1/3
MNDTKNIVLVLHGLTGGGDCNYIKDTLERLH